MNAGGVVACLALVLSVISIGLVMDERRRNEERSELVAESLDDLLEIDVVNEMRVNRIETFVYSGGAIDEREKGQGGGVW